MTIRRKMADWFIRNLSLLQPEIYRYGSAMLEPDGHRAITATSALSLSTCWSCISLVSQTISTLPLQVFQVDSKGNKVPARNHSLYPILHDQPNADMTASEFWEGMIATYLLRGNAYARKDFGGSRVIGLTPLRADLMIVDRARNGSLVYRYNEPEGRVREYDEEEILHLKGFSLDGIIGLSPISHARLSFGNALAAEDAVNSTFRNGLRPSGALAIDQLLKKGQRGELREALSEQMAGVANSGKLLLLEAGMKYTPISMPPEDAQLLETRSFNVEEICRWYRVNPTLVGHNSVSSWGSGIEQLQLQYLSFTLRPHLTKIEQAIRKSLIAPADRGKIFAEWNIQGLLRADSAARSQYYATLSANGIMTRNEIRALENLPPMPGGDSLTVQVAMTTLENLGKVPLPAKPPANQTDKEPAL